jgi:putative heme-binding domain-containing protein
LQAVDGGSVPSADITVDELRQAAFHGNEQIASLVRKHWGNIGRGTAEEQLATMRRFNNDLRAGTGEPGRGKELFAKHCGICHQFNGAGNKIGPDLTTANRQDLAALLGNIVDPSAVIRREYINYIVTTDSGRVLSGLLADQNAATVTILDAKNQRIEIPRNEIDALTESDVSLMPERILDQLSPQELRDLIAYLQCTGNTTSSAVNH